MSEAPPSSEVGAASRAGAAPAKVRTWSRWHLLTAILLAASAPSGTLAIFGRVEIVRAWRSAPPAAREELLYGQSGPAIARVRAAVPGNGSLLLVASLDPALFPYYLHPRRIFQRSTEPETDRAYMDLAPSHFPPRDPSSFPVDAVLVWDDATWERGGVLYPQVGRR